MQSVFVCNKCDKSYKHNSSLWKHKKFECGKAPTFYCQSQGCNYKAKRKDHFKIHCLNLHGTAEYLKYLQGINTQWSEAAGTSEPFTSRNMDSTENTESLLIISSECNVEEYT